jgi:hypothetical protein
MTLPLGKLGSVSSVVAASFYQGNHNRNYELAICNMKEDICHTGDCQNSHCQMVIRTLSKTIPPISAKSLKIPMVQSESVYRGTDNTMAKRKRTRRV